MIAKVIEQTDVLLDIEKPDAFLVYGDTNSCLSVIAAKKRKIPIFHMEAGNRCFDQCVPEEVNRKIIDHVSDINMVLSEHARRYLVAEGLPPERIIKTGSHMEEVFNFYMPKIKSSQILVTLGLEQGKYLLVSVHREENVDASENLLKIVNILKALHEQYHFPILVSTHPRTRNRLTALNIDLNSIPGVQFINPLGFLDYIRLEVDAFCTVSDSGTISEEASLLGFPAVTLRITHERPEGMDEGVLIMTGLELQNIMDAIRVVTTQCQQSDIQHKIVSDYLGGLVSRKILNIVHSYIGYVNRVVWKKYV
jgi:UDP-N-acetylglucosamine 2-epimerase (non-hydrolysing)